MNIFRSPWRKIICANIIWSCSDEFLKHLIESKYKISKITIAFLKTSIFTKLMWTRQSCDLKCFHWYNAFWIYAYIILDSSWKKPKIKNRTTIIFSNPFFFKLHYKILITESVLKYFRYAPIKLIYTNHISPSVCTPHMTIEPIR